MAHIGVSCGGVQVIPRKDLPRIYTMCIPVDDADKPQQRGDGMGLARKDLDIAREAVIDEVRKAPLRRNENMITRLYDSARHAKPRPHPS